MKNNLFKQAVLFLWLGFCGIGIGNAQTEYGQYPAGAFGQMKVAVVPPEGTTVMENGTLIYSASKFVDGDGVERDFETSVVANRTLGMKTTSLDIFGADYAFAGAIPFGNFAAPRPLPGDQESLGLGDVYLQPITLGWHSPAWHTAAAYGIFAPTGRFEYGARDNTGRGFWSHLFTLGVTYIEPSENPWNFTIQGRYEVPMEIEGSDVTPGQAFVAEYSIGKQITDNLDIGYVGYGVKQTTDIEGADFNGDPTRYQYFGNGIEAQYQAVKKETWGMLVSLRSYWESNVKNAPKGNFTVVSLAFAF